MVSVLMIVLVAVLATGTVVERLRGSEYALSHVYSAWWFVALWALVALGMVIMLFKRKTWKRPAICALHLSILLILLGALLTMLTGQHGRMMLEPGKTLRRSSAFDETYAAFIDNPVTSVLIRFC